ncbi:NAD-dependent epimerase/dehydratase family protein [Rickettsiella endosymbiont of Dermanyssus gallinae]|uniref:NAD-dependent epimerase/dehydratase family protein n=1 Tax=Rickettsiella endosymbiont of Dermanyssus gallinae TaxID=2856608 RepID=UPI001C529518|nr:NAD-dependent epimerase/dehydratase family protein [Rickettsiella endosymbiont of Dermanyssus gallinae]
MSLTFQNKKVLVVGGAGFVGSNLCKKLLEEDIAELIVIDNLLSSEISQLPKHPKLHFIFGSISHDAVLAKIPSDVSFIFHLATYHGNQSSIHDPLADHENNTLTSLKLFNHIKDFKHLEKVVYASAGCSIAKKTFDSAEATLEAEQVSLYLDSPYQMSKIFGEFYGNYFFTQNKLPFVKARFQNVYGPGEILGAGQWRGTAHTIWRNVIPCFIFKALNKEALPIENKGVASRDFIYVADIVKGLMRCATVGKSGESYNLASGQETSIHQLAELINQLTENATPINFCLARDWDRSGKRYGCTKKSEQEMNFTASVEITQGLEQTIDWTRVNLPLIQQCIDKHAYYLETV